MDAQDEKFFESLVGAAKPEVKAALEAEPAEPHQEATFAKAETAAVASRSRSSAARSAKAAAADDPAELEGQLTVDVLQTPDAIIVESAIAGVRPEDLDINVTLDSISIRGAREQGERYEDADYFVQECYWGRFARSIDRVWVYLREVNEPQDGLSKKCRIVVELPRRGRVVARRGAVARS